IGTATTSPTYTTQLADYGSTIAVTVIGTNSLGSAQAAAAAVGPVVDAPANTTAPGVSGSAVEGQQLTASNGSWTGYPAPTFGYQWQRCDTTGSNCAPIQGASGQTYTLLSADVGATVNVVLTGSNTSGSAQAPSAATGVVTSAAGPLTSLLDDFNRPDNGGPP